MTIYNVELFENNSLQDSLNAPIEKHFEWAVTHIYSTPYLHHLPRDHHGAPHAGRTAIYIPILANLYRKHFDSQAWTLTPRELKLLQIAAIFHDSGRENEGVDRWDKDSAVNLFRYLKHTLDLSEKEAIPYVEAIANKDYPSVTYSKFSPSISSWQTVIEFPIPQKSIYAKLIHDADCLDIKRRRYIFDGTYLDFYKKIVLKKNTASVYNEIGKIITEVSSLLDTEGDNIRKPHSKMKKKYEGIFAYSLIQSDILTGCIPGTRKLLRPFMKLLLGKGDLLSLEQLQEIDLQEIPFLRKIKSEEDSVQIAFMNNFLYSRTIRTPFAIVKKSEEKLKKLSKEDMRWEETYIQLEIRKLIREKGFETASGKLNKQGNPNRATSRLGWGAATYGNAGLLVFNESIENVRSVNATNIASGYGKRKSTTQATQEQLNQLLLISQLGGKKKQVYNYIATHNEVSLDISSIDMAVGVFFSRDSNALNKKTGSQSGYALHSHVPVLEAIYIQREYEIVTDILLPIYEYSGTHNFLTQRIYSEQDIVLLWKELCEDSFEFTRQALFDSDWVIDFEEDTIGWLKTIAMIGPHPFNSFYVPDSNYPLALQEAINQEVKNIFFNYFLSKIDQYSMQSDDDSILSSYIFQCKTRTVEILLECFDAAKKDVGAIVDQYEETLKDKKEFEPIFSILKKYFSKDKKENALQKKSDIPSVISIISKKPSFFSSSSNSSSAVMTVNKLFTPPPSAPPPVQQIR